MTTAAASGTSFQLNTTLKSRGDVLAQIGHLESLRARQHGTFQKNWDLGLFMRFILGSCGPEAKILDVGCLSNPLLLNLAHQGYKNLYGIDFKVGPGDVFPHENIAYAEMNLMKTTFPNGEFDCITSLSVIEHGCDPEAYFKEMARLLKPGGTLLTTTDYWPEKRATWYVPRLLTFGLPWIIRSREEIRELVACAGRHGLSLTSPLDDSAEETMVRWRTKSYTFILLSMRKDGR